MKFRFTARVWSIVSSVMVCGGALLGFTLSYWFLILVPLGIFGPGLARRLGLLRDADEFVLEAQNSAAWAAFGSVSLAGILLFILERRGVAVTPSSSDGILVLLTLGFTVYAACYLFRFWNGRKAGQIMLYALAVAWALFVILSEWGDPVGMGREGLSVVAPFILLALLGRFFPRVAGVLCLLAAAASVFAFNALDFAKGPNLFVFAAISLPLIVVGIGMLVREKGKDTTKDTTKEEP